jgi:hypothetical protein
MKLLHRHYLLLPLLALAFVSGCDQPTSVPVQTTTESDQTAQSAPANASPVVDISRPFGYTYEASADSDEPLSVARALSRSAGGTWVVLAPKPLDDVLVSGQSNNDSGVDMTMMSMSQQSKPVQSVMDAMHTAGTPMAWDTSKGYMLLDFASPDDLARIKSQPPVRTVGIFLRGPDDGAMLKAFADFEHITIVPSDALLKQRAAFRAARSMGDTDDTDSANDPSTMYQRIASGGDTSVQPTLPEITVIAKLDLNGLMQHIAEYYGGEFVNTSGSEWQLKPYADPAKVQSKIARLKQDIDDAEAEAPAEQTSFESRQNPGAESDATREQEESVVIRTPLGDDITADYDTLGMLGEPAIPTLASYLTVDKPQYAIAAIRTLGAMSSPQAGAALDTFQSSLEGPPKAGQSPAALNALQQELIRIIARRPVKQAEQPLATLALDTDADAATRTDARLALAEIGDITAFAGSANQTPPSIGTPTFTILSSARMPAGPIDPNAVTPLATTKSKDGDNWAVFVAGDYGNANDYWLAHGRNGEWSEFLFTGETFAPSQNTFNYGANGAPGVGSCRLSVDGDTVIISPPASSPAAKLQQIQSQMMSPKLSTAQRQALINQMTALESSQNGQMLAAQGTVVRLSLTALRAGSNHDGLTDVAEKRFDADGLQDALNVQAKPATSDRANLLQMVFTALFGGDKSAVPIVVVLDRPFWQAFTGCAARVCCLTPDDALHRINQISSFRLLQFGGPADQNSTILQRDGPCLFNDSRTKAEVHFFFIADPSSQDQTMSYEFAMGAGPTQDYVAIFDRSGNWTLKSLRPWKFDTASQAFMKYMQARAITGAGFGEE